MNSYAPGQLLGYSIQFQRALYHLMKSGPGDAVYIEMLGDVSKIAADLTVLSEEDKSSISCNPLTDKSTNLWKTFSNWVNALIRTELDIHKTEFVLYTNQAGELGIVHSFDLAISDEEVSLAIKNAKENLNDITQSHPAWKYYNNVINEHPELLSKVIQKFHLEIGSGAGYEEVEQELIRNHVEECHVEDLLHALSGWLMKSVLEKIAAKDLPKIHWEDFSKKFKAYFSRIQRLELIDFTKQYKIQQDEIDKQVKVRPKYLQQLQAINCEGDDLIEAVTDYLRAKVNRDKWIEKEIIDENAAEEFQDKLVSFWKTHQKYIELTDSKLSDKLRGGKLLYACQCRQETIRDSSPPASTISGTYHALADETLLGWHPNWKTLFNG